MKIAVELIEGRRYKLRMMMGVPDEDPCNDFCDNEVVVKNSTWPELTLKKELQAIAYPCTCEAQAAGMVQITKEDGETNLADIFKSKTLGMTKALGFMATHPMVIGWQLGLLQSR